MSVGTILIMVLICPGFVPDLNGNATAITVCVVLAISW